MASNNTDNAMDELDDNGYLSLSEKEKTVQSLARLSLVDNGQRNWQEESKQYLDVNYPDWKTPQSTRMVPPVFPSKAGQPTSGDEAEDKMFNLIEEFGQKYSQPMFVVHSYDFAALIETAEKGYCSREWMKGECDFVIIHRHFGLFFIEVKSNKTTRIVYEEGLKQISKVKKVIASYCKKIFQGGKKKATEKEIFKYAGFVALPNCNREESFDCGLFKEDCQDVDSFKKWWDQNIVRTNGGIRKDIYEALTVRLVPITCIAPTLNLQIRETHRRIILYTPEQLQIMLQSRPKQWIAGPAGCGKTVLLILKVEKVVSDIMKLPERNHEKVLVLCYNSPLSIYLDNEIKFKPPVVTIKTYDSFMKMVFTDFISTTIPCVEDGKPDFEMIRAEVKDKFKYESPPDEAKFDHIFVDEGQDFRREWLELLDKFHKKPDMTQEQKYQSYFWVMFDSNQHVQFSKRAELPWKHLNQASKLTSILRNTAKIFLESKKHFDGLFNEDIKLGHKEVGLNVKFDDALLEDRSNGVDILSKHIEELMREAVERKDVIILTREEKDRDHLIENLTNNDDSEIEIGERRLSSRKNVIAVESIRRFKGLESKVVIVYDPKCHAPTNDDRSRARELLYIAMSRCFCYLVIVSTKGGCRAMSSETLPAFLPKNTSSNKKDVRPSREQTNDIKDRHRRYENYANFSEFGKTSRSSMYDSGPPERKRLKDSEDDEKQGDPETIESAVMVSKIEERQTLHQYDMTRPVESRLVRVPGSNILEPGDTFIKDSIRNKVFSLLTDFVKINLSFEDASISDEEVNTCVKNIEYQCYQEHKHKRNSKGYTKQLRTLKREIEGRSKDRKTHQTVLQALSKQSFE